MQQQINELKNGNACGTTFYKKTFILVIKYYIIIK